MKQGYHILDWDTNFFGFKVAKIQNDLLHLKSNSKCFGLLKKGDVKLAYYNSKAPIETSLLENDDYDIFLVNKRVLLEKNLTNLTDIHPKISFYKKEFPNEEMIRLAQRAGSQGRFGSDPYISKIKHGELYKQWIINSVKKKIASEVLVYTEEGKIVGLATVKFEGDFAYMPLFAVERKYEGKGISFALMRAVESVALQRGYSKVLGGTQEINLKALKIYERYGIEVIGDEYIYHFWAKWDQEDSNWREKINL